MGRSAKLRLASLLVLGAIAVPTTALASSGGSGLPGPTNGTSITAPAVAGVSTQTVSGGGLTFSSRTAGLRGGTMWFTGTTTSGGSGRALVIQRQSGTTWVPVANATTRSGGAFTVAWHVNTGGNQYLRAATADGSAASPAVPVVIYKRSIATEYGPGFYGHKTACGVVLRKVTIGVANRTLPCGSAVSVFYRGRTIVIPVIDRGPYANNANWDLTMATGRALGIGGTTTIGTITVSAQYRPLK